MAHLIRIASWVSIPLPLQYYHPQEMLIQPTDGFRPTLGYSRPNYSG